MIRILLLHLGLQRLMDPLETTLCYFYPQGIRGSYQPPPFSGPIALTMLIGDVNELKLAFPSSRRQSNRFACPPVSSHVSFGIPCISSIVHFIVRQSSRKWRDLLTTGTFLAVTVRGSSVGRLTLTIDTPAPTSRSQLLSRRGDFFAVSVNSGHTMKKFK